MGKELSIDCDRLRQIFRKEGTCMSILTSLSELGIPQTIVEKYPQMSIIAWSSNWCLEIVECVRLVCLSLTLTRNKQRSWLSSPSEVYSTCRTRKFYILFSGGGRKYYPVGRKFETPELNTFKLPVCFLKLSLKIATFWTHARVGGLRSFLVLWHCMGGVESCQNLCDVFLNKQIVCWYYRTLPQHERASHEKSF